MTSPSDPFQPTAPPAYGAPAYGGVPGPEAGPPRNGLGVAALVCGIVAFITFWVPGLGLVLAVAAIVLGVLGRSRAKRGMATNGGLALAGLILGVVSLLLAALVVAGFVALFNSSSGKDLTSCLKNAGSDQAATQQCQQQFSKQLSKP